MNVTAHKLIPKNPDGKARVLVIGRVSTPQQDVGNIEAGYEYVERMLKPLFEGKTIVTHLGEQGSGMRTDRRTIIEAGELIETGEIDVVLMEDVSKPYRNPRWIYAFIQDCVDHDTRVIAPGDNLDTVADENWEVTLGAAALRHGLHIPDTRRRVRRTADRAFQEGGQVGKTRFGYIKLTKEAARAQGTQPAGLRITKVAELTPIIQELCRKIVEDRWYGSRVVNWLKKKGVAPGPYSKGEWTWPLIKDFLRDPILYGLRRQRQTIYRPIFKTGKHKRAINPQPESKLWPELAHMTKKEWDELQCALDELGEDGQSEGENAHSRRGVPRDHSIIPLQLATCHVCGRYCYPSGDGSIRCQSAFPRYGEACWNHALAKIELIRERIIDLLLEKVASHPEGRRVMLDAAWEAVEERRRNLQQDTTAMEKQLADLKGQEKSVVDGIALAHQTTCDIAVLINRLATIQAAIKDIQIRIDAKPASSGNQSWPDSREALDANPRQCLLEVARTSFEFSAFVRSIVASLTLRPVQAIDSDQVHLRAEVTLDLTVLAPAPAPAPGPSSAAAAADNGAKPGAEVFTFDLFEPPAHIRLLPDVLRVKAELAAINPKRAGYVNIAARLTEQLAGTTGEKVGRMTVKRALAFKRLMDEHGVTEPYRVLIDAPSRASRWNPRQRTITEAADAADAVEAPSESLELSLVNA